MSVVSKWLHKEKFYCVNAISTAVLRSIWLNRNVVIFDKQARSSVKWILRKTRKILLDWELICRELKKEEMKKWLSSLDKLI
jgi:hypothetical protein